jgi:hypothetical protein
MRESAPRFHSRIAGRGAIARSLAGLILRVSRYARARAATSDERQWAAKLADRLDAAYREALDSPGAPGALAAADARAGRARKVAR